MVRGVMGLSILPSFADFAGQVVAIVWSLPTFFLLLGVGLLMTIVTRFIQWRALTHGVAVVRGDYDRTDDPGQISHFQALCAALSATVGLGNIGGVAAAVAVGGPGAIFWMWVVGLTGMALKFSECTLAVMFRDTSDTPEPGTPPWPEPDDRADDETSRRLPHAQHGEVRGGPMWYISKALAEPLRARGNPLWVVFRVLAILFSCAAMLSACGGGNMFQGWNVAAVLSGSFGVAPYVSASVVTVLVAVVIIGGIRRIGAVASALVPLMCVVYVVGCLAVVVLHAESVPGALQLIVRSAFNPAEAGGAFLGVTAWGAFTFGLRRALFSNEAGEGSAPMAHAAARTDEPVREGVVAGLEPFIDTLVICTLSGLVIVMTGAWNRPAIGEISRVDADKALVSTTPQLPDAFGGLYCQQLVNDQRVAIHLAADPSDSNALVTVDVPIIEREWAIDAPERSRTTLLDQLRPADRWDDLAGITLDLTAAPEPLRARIQPGCAVHLRLEGAELTGFAFDTTLPGFGTYFLTLAVCLFAFSTMISWSYYGEKAAEFLWGATAILPFKLVFVVCVFIGMVLPRFSAVYDFSDAAAGMMALCNLPALVLLSPVVARATRRYFRRLKSGAFVKQRR